MTEQVVIDSLGEFCPMPLIRLAKAVAVAAPGTEIVVLSDDEAAKVDIPVWCRLKRHTFIGRRARERGWAFVVRVEQTDAPPVDATPQTGGST